MTLSQFVMRLGCALNVIDNYRNVLYAIYVYIYLIYLYLMRSESATSLHLWLKKEKKGL